MSRDPVVLVPGSGTPGIHDGPGEGRRAVSCGSSWRSPSRWCW
ncbi:MAG TPA: hypothetical protein VGX28_13260 [Frankiaceae bacterium]|nr:hypothetical protein [Frankiaceae bacterium]